MSKHIFIVLFVFATIAVFGSTGYGQIFNDVPLGHWAYDYINTLYNNGVTRGCVQDDPNTPENERRYCPGDPVTREQMAAFIIRAIEGEPSSDYCGSSSPFLDVSNTDNFCPYIKRLYERGVTTGCGSGNYCPKQYVTREQMAAFLIRAKESEPTTNYCVTGSLFDDVTVDGWACRHIRRLKELGITTGCGGNNYCPSSYVTRDQMAAFLVRAFLASNAGTMRIALIDAATKEPVPGVTVQLDGTGVTTAITDGSGIATFTGITPGAHDVHVFPAGYTWVSAYQLNTDHVVLALNALNDVVSYINFTGNVSNVAVGYTGAQFVLKTTSNSYYTNMIGVIGSYNLSISLRGVSSGTMVNGTLYVLEQGADPVTGVVRVVDTPDIGTQGNQQIYTTVAYNNVSRITLNLTYNTSKPPLETLAHLNAVTPPSGTTWYGVTAYADTGRNALLASDFSGSPVTIQAFDPFNPLPASHTVSVFDTSASWIRTESVAYASYVPINASFTGMPGIADQSGATIAFTPGTGAGITTHGVSISDSLTGNTLWEFYGPAGTNNFTIPALPAGVTSVLTQGSDYAIAAESRILGTLTYDRLFSVFGNQVTYPLPWEVGISGEARYTR